MPTPSLKTLMFSGHGSGDTCPLSLRVLFWTSVLIALASRSISAYAQEQFVPEQWMHDDWIFFSLLAFYVPTIALWPFLPWKPEESLARRSFSYAFLGATVLLLPVLDFGHYFIIIVSVAHALYAHNLLTALAVCLAFGLANFATGAFHPLMPTSLAATNSALLLGYCLGVLTVVASLLSAGHRARQTRELLGELTEAHRKLRHYSSRIRELAVEEERGRMAREMHDSTGHYLTAIKLCLSSARRSSDGIPEVVREEIDDAHRLAGEALTETRRWVRALRPLDLEQLNGPEALQGLTTAFKDTGVHTEFRLVGTWPEDMDGEVELALYRTVQEGLTNALRYSQAARITVDVKIEEGTAAVDVVDDGTGVAEGHGASGFGLSSLEERLTSLGGDLETGNRPEGGFRLSARVPCQPAYLLEETQ
jgi:signal transduction histidine kinase